MIEFASYAGENNGKVVQRENLIDKLENEVESEDTNWDEQNPNEDESVMAMMSLSQLLCLINNVLREKRVVILSPNLRYISAPYNTIFLKAHICFAKWDLFFIFLWEVYFW